MKTTRPINVTGNPDWRYTQSGKTDVRATIRKEMKRIADAKARAAEQNSSVPSLESRRKAASK